MVELKKTGDCCGCMACIHVCRHGAIKPEKDPLGFTYVRYDDEKCVGCGECDRVCDFNSGRSLQASALPHACAMRLKDMADMAKSQSGGAFIALSDTVLSEGGVIYGAGFGEGFAIKHMRAETASGRDSFRGSKYVQSDMQGIYPRVSKDLENGRKVLFSGTPCQVAALRRYIPGELQGNLLSVDVICHGVAAPGLWRDYLKYLEKKYRGKIAMARFRDKKFGWQSQHESFTFEGGKTIYPKFLIYQNYLIRESCAQCPYTNLNRPSDITIGDYWGLERLSKDFCNDNKGCSLVLCNTEKGREYFEKAKRYIEYLPAGKPDLYLQPNLESPTVIPPRRARFEKMYKRLGIRVTLMAFSDNRPMRFMRRIIRRVICK